MSRIWNFTSGLFKSEIREFQVMFWSFIFPLILYFILTSVFGSLYGDDTQGISFRVGIVREESLSGLGMILDEVIEDISSENGPFVKKEYGSIDEALIDLKEGKQDIVLVIPEGPAQKLQAPLFFRLEKSLCWFIMSAERIRLPLLLMSSLK